MEGTFPSAPLDMGIEMLVKVGTFDVYPTFILGLCFMTALNVRLSPIFWLFPKYLFLCFFSGIRRLLRRLDS